MTIRMSYPKVSLLILLLLSTGIVCALFPVGEARALPATAIVPLEPDPGASVPPVDQTPVVPPAVDTPPATAMPSVTDVPAILVPIVPAPREGGNIPPPADPPVVPPPVVQDPGVSAPISSDPGSSNPTGPPDAALAAPLIQGPEQFGLANGCAQGNTLVPVGAPCIGGAFDVSECVSSQSTCEMSGQGAQCVAHNTFKPDRSICKVATGACELHSRCDANGTCVAYGSLVCPPPSEDGCVTHECPEPGGETCVEKHAVPVDCQYEVLPPQNPVCGATYIGTVSIISPAKCGGQQCPTTISVMAPPCTPTATTTVTPTVTETATLTQTQAPTVTDFSMETATQTPVGSSTPHPTATHTSLATVTATPIDYLTPQATATQTPKSGSPLCLLNNDLGRWGACGEISSTIGFQGPGRWIPIITWTGGAPGAIAGIYVDADCTTPATTIGGTDAVAVDNSADDVNSLEGTVEFRNDNRNRCPTISKTHSYVGVSDGTQKVCVAWNGPLQTCFVDPPPPPPPTATPMATPTVTPASNQDPASTCDCGYKAPPGSANGEAFCQAVCASLPGNTQSRYFSPGYCVCSGVPESVCPSTAAGVRLVEIGTAGKSGKCMPLAY